mmetsp:Transcript_11814/g.18140  ORF Transcript_11814/g.18140 Transcript_11814/m.18140 type:complete len:95 (+) Transcript_11814:217-501(+)
MLFSHFLKRGLRLADPSRPIYGLNTTGSTREIVTTQEIFRLHSYWLFQFPRLLNFSLLEEFSIWNMSSTLKKRRAKMNKHKLKKRRKKNRYKNK